MSSRRRNYRHGTGRDIRSWPVLLLLLVAVLVPTVCVLWLMTRAIANERAAVRQQLTQAYAIHLTNAQNRLTEHWREKAAALDLIAADRPGPAVFAECVLSGLADSAVCFNAAHEITYPAAAAQIDTDSGLRRSAWAEASRLEFIEHDPKAAAHAYAAIAKQAGYAASPDEAARAILAEARCRGQAGETAHAIRLLTQTLGQDLYRTAVDAQGRLIVADARLRALELMGSEQDDAFRSTAEALKAQLADYDNPTPPASQRRFLMKRLEDILKQEGLFPTLPAEELAARFIDASRANAGDPETRFELDAMAADAARVRTGHPTGVLRLASPSGRVLALLQTETVISEARAAIGQDALPPDSSIRLLEPGRKLDGQAVLDSRPAGEFLPEWRIVFSLDNAGILDEAADERIATYLWTGILVVVAVFIIALLIAKAFRQQMRLARLKNDLVATVSHELKTPLASIRLLVDTLLDEQKQEEKTVREYLQMIAKENTRLSRLIDNFLAFSRMERNKHAFELVQTEPSEAVKAALDAVGERFTGPDCRLSVDVNDRLPHVIADADAIVTVVLNLLDNAYKYTQGNKEIALKVYPTGGNVCFEVADNGIGISKADCRRIFNRFYQANRHLTSGEGGCGLGLSIVRFIVAAHDGTVHVKSRPGHGSTFTVALPAATDQSHTDQRA